MSPTAAEILVFILLVLLPLAAFIALAVAMVAPIPSRTGWVAILAYAAMVVIWCLSVVVITTIAKMQSFS